MKAVRIPSGEYKIGSAKVPGAGPRHRRRISKPFWIDATPVSWAHFEMFVAAGGFGKRTLWSDVDYVERISRNGIDERCRTLIERAEELNCFLGDEFRQSRAIPLTGITWLEASAICRFFGARLPYEAEWEIAMRGKSEPDSLNGGDLWQVHPSSQYGCKILIGTLQEWTADAFQSRYWQADFNRRGIDFNPEAPGVGVTVRGAAPSDVYRHVSYRSVGDPNNVHAFLGFRRVWDCEPNEKEIGSICQRLEEHIGSYRTQ